jgi:hypothetical protein
MKNTRYAVHCLMASLVAGCVSAGAQAKEMKPQPAVSAEQHDMQSAMPGAEHNGLAKLAGEYTTATKLFMQPGASPAESTGTAKLSMTLDGRFLVEDDTGTFMGQSIKGFKMVGYNNASKRYEGVWTYTMATGIMTLNGTSTDGGKTLTFAATFDGEGGKKETLQIVMKQNDDDHFVVELSGNMPDGKPGPRLVTTYSRKK